MLPYATLGLCYLVVNPGFRVPEGASLRGCQPSGGWPVDPFDLSCLGAEVTTYTAEELREEEQREVASLSPSD